MVGRRPTSVFYAYPSERYDLVEAISLASKMVDAVAPQISLIIWPQMNIFGQIIPDRITKDIDAADVLFCDMTIPNQNVYYEFGYAVGSGKSVGITINSAHDGAIKSAQADGLFDTIGYKQYENSNQLADILAAPPNASLLELYSKDINQNQPVFILDTLKKTDFRNYIVSAVKANRTFYRSFDPAEIPRFGCTTMIGEVTSASGVLIPFLPSHIEDASRHNLRASFLSGLAHGMGKPTLLIEQSQSYSPPPTDLRERITFVRSSEEISTAVSTFVSESASSGQKARKQLSEEKRNPLQGISLGASAAENEFRTLQSYFVRTAEFLKCSRGELNIVAGRKGSGKTAIFFQVRDNSRKDKSAIVVDLKPESHQLSLFREEMLKVVDAGVFDHSISAIWYFLILTEIVLNIKANIEHSARPTSETIANLDRIEKLCRKFQIYQSGDFTFRITKLSGLLLRELQRMRSVGENITPEKITNIVFAGGISELRMAIEELTDTKTTIWFLFDNIDKGWPATGLNQFDVRMVRLLLEALTKTGRDFHNIRRSFFSIIFVRNDVLELMVTETPDRNKWAQVRIDWSDKTKLRQVIFERLRGSSASKNISFEGLWAKYFCETISGQHSFDYFVDHCLMRPRFLINIIENAISNAINRGNQTVLEKDCIDAVMQHSNYLVDDFGYEIKDISGLTSDILYSLLGISDIVTKDEILERFVQFDIAEDQLQQAFHLMLWYGIVGIATDDTAGKFIYDFDYNMRRLEAEIRRSGDNILYCTNPAVHVALRA